MPFPAKECIMGMLAVAGRDSRLIRISHEDYWFNTS